MCSHFCKPSIYAPSADIDSSGRAFYRVAPMHIDTPLERLGEVPMAALRDTVLALDEDSLRDQQYRQETSEVHHSGLQGLVDLVVE